MLLLPLFALGCFLPVDGRWEGACDLSDGSNGEPLFLALDLEAGLGRRVRATGEATLTSRGLYPVSFEGKRTSTALTLEGSIPLEDGEVELWLQAAQDGPALEGDCRLWVPGAISPIPGEVELSR
jgi:hypothetical protein